VTVALVVWAWIALARAEREKKGGENGMVAVWYFYTRSGVRCVEAFGSLDAAMHAASLDLALALAEPHAIQHVDESRWYNASAIRARHQQVVARRLTQPMPERNPAVAWRVLEGGEWYVMPAD
jgi:hypothetical protein